LKLALGCAEEEAEMKSLIDKLPATTRRVEQNTASEVNGRLRQQMEADVARYEGADNDSISERIAQLEQEWDIERVLEANAATIALVSVILGFTVNKKWFAFTGVVMAFLLQHAVQGWCPPAVPWRHAGIRTQSEIHDEITALRILRGDFKPTDHANEATAQVTGHEF
jgi:hypothetical protein